MSVGGLHLGCLCMNFVGGINRSVLLSNYETFIQNWNYNTELNHVLCDKCLFIYLQQQNGGGAIHLCHLWKGGGDVINEQPLIILND